VKVSGSHELSGPPERVWAALTDPAVLARTIPGALALQRVGEDEYRVTVEAGVASIRGVYEGLVTLADQRPPEGYTLRASGSGAPGTIDATCAITLTPSGAGTRLAYDADAAVGGTVAGVGQRVLAGVAKRTATQFFAAIDAELTAPAAGAPPPEQREDEEAVAGEVFGGRRAAGRAAQGSPVAYLVGAVVGAAIALAGVAVGRWTARAPRPWWRG